jgi:serine/threonine protein kinase
MYQLISGISDLHSEGIVHRDIKPSNILLNTEIDPTLLVADFSSAWSNSARFTSRDFYGSKGPSTDEESLQYAAPEVLLSLNHETGSNYF